MLKQNKHHAHFVPDVRCERNTVINYSICCKADKLASFKHVYMPLGKFCKWLITVLACRQQAAVMSSTWAWHHSIRVTAHIRTHLSCCVTGASSPLMKPPSRPMPGDWRQALLHPSNAKDAQHSSTTCIAQQHSTHATSMAPIGLPGNWWQVCGYCTIGMGVHAALKSFSL